MVELVLIMISFVIQRTIKDWQLILLVLAACAFDIVYVSLALGLDDYGPVNVPYVESPSDLNVSKKYCILYIRPSDVM